jgi:hypothetical protein
LRRPPTGEGSNKCVRHAQVNMGFHVTHRYKHAAYIYEGDTPSFLHLIPTGLGDPEQPHLGTCGGRFTAEPQKNIGAPAISRVTQHKYCRRPRTREAWRPRQSDFRSYRRRSKDDPRSMHASARPRIASCEKQFVSYRKTYDIGANQNDVKANPFQGTGTPAPAAGYRK